MIPKRKIIEWLIDVSVVLLLIACLWVPDASKALARGYVWTQFQHWDQNIMMPGLGFTHGLGLNSDIFSPWGAGAVVVISRLAQLLGGFDYAHVLQVLMSMAILYYVLFYFFVKSWLGETLLAVFAVAVAVKIQMFHAGISPLIWNFPQDTPVRHLLDLIVLLCLFKHARSFQIKYLAAAAIGIAASLAWVPSTGLCLLAAFWGYVIYLLINSQYRACVCADFNAARWLFICSVVPFLAAGEVWKNIHEPLQLFLLSSGTVSIYTCLYDRHFFAFITGFAIPIIYAWTFIVTKDIFVIPLCIYGLALYTHYLAQSTTSHYYAVAIPLVLVICWWASLFLKRFNPAIAVKMLLCLSLGAWSALFTNIFFVYYPNIFDISRMDWSPEKNMYLVQSHFDQDAAMIDRLTTQDQPVALISSFETQILIQAKRKPFFYYAPLVTSERLDINGFAGTTIYTQERLSKTLNQIMQQAPDYIFIEKRLLGQWPAQYAQSFPGIIIVLRDVLQHYQPQEQGMYLIALHKKI